MRMKWLAEYQCWVFDDGKVATPSKKGLTFRKPHRDKHGYLRCRIHSRSAVLIHRLLALAFINNTENKPTVDHIDRNPSNNSLDNLRWASFKEQADNRGIVENSINKYGVRQCENKKLYDFQHAKEYYVNNKEKITAKHKEYRAKHINEYRAYQAKWHREHYRKMKENTHA